MRHAELCAEIASQGVEVGAAKVPGSPARAKELAAASPAPPRVVSRFGAKVDLIPAGRELVTGGELRWPNGDRMSLVGMDLSFAHAQRHELGNGRSVSVALAQVVTLLEMVSSSMESCSMRSARNIETSGWHRASARLTRRGTGHRATGRA